MTLVDNRVAGDVFTTSYTSASFADKNVGTGKTVSVSGITISRHRRGNYTCNTTATTTADITARALTVERDRRQQGLRRDDRRHGDPVRRPRAGDVLTTSYTSASFADKNVGTARR